MAPDEALSLVLASLQSCATETSPCAPVNWQAMSGKIADTFNDDRSCQRRCPRSSSACGQRGRKRKAGTQASARAFSSRVATWGEMGSFSQHSCRYLLRPTTEVIQRHRCRRRAKVTWPKPSAWTCGWPPSEGDPPRSANIVNTMIQQLGVFTAEVTRVA